MVNGNQFPPKDPSAVLDYQFDWAAEDNNTGLTNWLAEGETIVSHSVTVPDGITLVSSSIVNNGTTVLFWLSGGDNGVDYSVNCRITTQTRTDSRTAIVPVRKR